MTLVKRLLDWKALGVHPEICLDAAVEIQMLQARTRELERDNEHLRAEIEVLQRMRHASNPTFTLRPWTPEELEQLAREKP